MAVDIRRFLVKPPVAEPASSSVSSDIKNTTSAKEDVPAATVPTPLLILIAISDEREQAPAAVSDSNTISV